MSPQTFIIFGRSGSGKGTQAELLIDYLKMKDADRETLYVESGEKLREFIDSDNSLSSKLTREIMDRGELVPDFLPVWLWSGSFIKNITGNEHIILDGLCRIKDEAPILDSALKFYKRQKPFVLSIEVGRSWATDRLLGRARGDDNDDDILKRLDWYEKSVIPAIEYFKNNDYYNFLKINGEQTIEEVHQEIVEKLGW